MENERKLTDSIKTLFGEIPYLAEWFWYLRQRDMPTTVMMDLQRLRAALPGWVLELTQSGHARPNRQPRKIALFAQGRDWLEYMTLVGLAYAGNGDEVALTYLPYDHWKRSNNAFDLRRQNVYIRESLRPVKPFMKVVSLWNMAAARRTQLPSDLQAAIDRRAYYDVQYTTSLERVDKNSELYRLRMERNTSSARQIYAWLIQLTPKPDVVIVPNGSVMEYGVFYEVCKYLDVPVVTFEFGEQNHRIWIAQNDDSMLQKTDDLWRARGQIPLTNQETARVRDMFASRQGAKLWETFSWQWQGAPIQGETAVRRDLNLDNRPLAFIATNVMGDSLTLRREVFTEIIPWLEKTILYFKNHPEFQAVIRIHPGELMQGWGVSVYTVLTEIFPTLPENIRLIPNDAKVNSYDLAAIADLGLVYTTTMGMEIAMSGRPVMVVGNTHYRGKGFTLDPQNWDAYFSLLESVLRSPEAFKPTHEQVELAWRYAYRFFFEYPLPFPWHLWYFWADMGGPDKPYSLYSVLTPEGWEQFEITFDYLAGRPIDWANPL